MSRPTRARPRHRRRGALLLLLALHACAPRTIPAPGESPGSGATAEVSDRLFLGRGIPGGGTVSDTEWEAFVRDVVTPRFPDGLTVWRAEGQWRGADGVVVREPVMVLEVLHPASSAADSTLRAIAAEYKRRFRQEAVLRVTTPARMQLFE